MAHNRHTVGPHFVHEGETLSPTTQQPIEDCKFAKPDGLKCNVDPTILKWASDDINPTTQPPVARATTHPLTRVTTYPPTHGLHYFFVLACHTTYIILLGLGFCLFAFALKSTR